MRQPDDHPSDRSPSARARARRRPRPATAARRRLAVAMGLPLLAGLCWLLASPPVRASEAHAPAAAHAATPAAKAPAAKAPAAPPPKAAAAQAESADPMEHLRQRLQDRLGAQKAPEAATPYDVRVPTRGAREGAGGKGRVDVAALAAQHRADKAHGGAPGHDLHWSYAGEGGPQAWGSLKPEFGLCATGQRQSPIDIRDGIAVELEPIVFDYRPSAFGVVDNGHTVQVNVAAGNQIQVLGRRYDLVQFHFHRPSEERINGRVFDMVAHLVHKDPEGRLAVVAVLLEQGGAQPVVQSVWNNLPLEKNEQVNAAQPIDLNGLLPQDRRYYTYMGSLTTPPCSEGVLWMVMKQPVPVSSGQIGVFSKLYPMNARPVQSAGGRLIKQSN